MENIEESEETLNTEEEETSTNDEQEDVEELKEKLAKAEELANNQKIRAEKAEKKAKQPKEEDTSKKSEDDTSKNKKYSLDEIEDITALSSIPKEDRADVLDYAESKGITPAEAMKTPMIKSFLTTQEDTRKTAEASNTGGSKRGSNKVTGERLIEDFEKGKVPETEADITKLAEARIAQKKAISKANK